MRTDLAGLVLATVLGSLAGGSLPEVDRAAPCMPCHGGSSEAAQDLVAEWRASPYSDPVAGRGCVDCHPAASTSGASERAGEVALTRAHRASVGVAVGLIVERSEGGLLVQASLCNSGTGHSLPAAAWPEVMVLLVTARNSQGLLLELLSGPRPPPWSGVEGAEVGGCAWAGSRGPEEIPQHRLAPYGTEVSRFVFRSAAGPLLVEARVLRGRAGANGWGIRATARSTVGASHVLLEQERWPLTRAPAYGARWSSSWERDAERVREK